MRPCCGHSSGALDRCGSRSEALAIMARFERLCREELDGEPEPATRALADAIRAGHLERTPPAPSDALPRPRSAAPLRSKTLPVPLTPFVGRRDLVAAVSRELTDPACRVLTLVGPGGVGKSRIAIEVAREVGGRFEGDTPFVELAALTSDGALLAAIAGAIGIDLDPGQEAKPQLLRALERRRMLLVLDNAEHLEGVPALVAELVSRAPGATVLITSRRATGLAGESIVDVAGLAHLDGARRGGRSLAGRAAAPCPTESAELFVQVARRAGAVLGSADVATIERLCTRLGGVPLAIELAAPWTRILDLRQVEDALTWGIDILSGEAPDRPERHASMRVVFDHSWATLQLRERAAMRRLAPFRGGFTLEAAREVAEIEVPVLLALTNKSFLRRSGDGRMSRHPLVWRYAFERAKEHPVELDAARDRHAAYFLGFLAARQEAFHHADGERMMLEIAPNWRT
jgi:predicted ATPase